MGWCRQRCRSLVVAALNSQPFSSRITHHTSRVQAITFDVGGTLIQPWPSVGHIYAAVAARHGLHDIPVDALNRQFAFAWKNLPAFNYTRLEWRSLVNQTFLGLTQAPISDTVFLDLYDSFAQGEAWRIFDDVFPALEFLNSRGLKLGIISNWDERLRPLLHELNLDRFFQTIVVSFEANACKPSPTIFHQAAQYLRVNPGEILHVGDSPALDVAGATAAGFQALLLFRDAESRPGQLKSLLELPTFLRQQILGILTKARPRCPAPNVPKLCPYASPSPVQRSTRQKRHNLYADQTD
jgi:putative hydrolase of the HAD superfamily